MRVYVAGPMTGIPQFNFPAFDLAASALRELGFEVVNPAELDDPAIRAISMASPDGSAATLDSHGQTHGDFLARDVKIIADGGIERIYVLPGWRQSKGALWETFCAHLNSIPIYWYGGAHAGEAVTALDRVSAWARGLWFEAQVTVLREALADAPRRLK